MLKYFVIVLDDTSVSYCHYENSKIERKLISLEDLKAGVIFAMKENMTIQFVYPDYELPEEYKDVIHSIDHVKIVPASYDEQGDVVVLNGTSDIQNTDFDIYKTYILRLEKADLFANIDLVRNAFDKVHRLNLVIKDLYAFTEDDFVLYKESLKILSNKLETLLLEGCSPQCNLLTDRMLLTSMNNCNAGCENITLAPDGKFYVCPAFYLACDEEDYGLDKSKFSIGNLNGGGLEIKNPQLYKLSHAPICRNCDAYQCKRCVWLNRKMTYELNTPSHEQCVVAHLERNASRELIHNIRKHAEFLPHIQINEIRYLDPFDLRKEW